MDTNDIELPLPLLPTIPHCDESFPRIFKVWCRDRGLPRCLLVCVFSCEGCREGEVRVFAPVFAISRNIKTGNSCSSFLLSDSPPEIDECKERGCFPFSCSVLSFEKHEGGGGDTHKGGAGDTRRSRGCFPFFEIHIISYLSRGAASLLRWCSFSLCSLCSLSFTPTGGQAVHGGEL